MTPIKLHIGGKEPHLDWKILDIEPRKEVDFISDAANLEQFQDNSIQAIIHIHNLELWNQLMDKVPTTKKEVPYGTPEMAKEVFRLFQETNVKEEKIIVMAGHDEGIIAFGKDLDEAGSVLLNFLTKFN